MKDIQTAVSLSTQYFAEEGERLAVLGSAPGLGCWKPDGLLATELMPGRWRAWHKTGVLSEEYKWVVLKYLYGSSEYVVKRWEDGPNRVLKIPRYAQGSHVHIESQWNGPQQMTVIGAKSDMFESVISIQDFWKMPETEVVTIRSDDEIAECTPEKSPVTKKTRWQRFRSFITSCFGVRKHK